MTLKMGVVNIDKLPPKWKWAKLGEVCNIISGKRQNNVVNPKGKYPIYGSSGVFGYADDYLCNEGSTVIGRKGTINSPLFVNTKFWNVDTAFGLSTNHHYDNKLLYYFCLGFNFHALDKSTTIPSLAKRDLLSIDIPVPPQNVQKQIVSKIEALFSELDKGIEELKKTQQQLKVYRQAVLKWAFEGRFTNKTKIKYELPKTWKIVLIEEVAENLDNKRKPINKTEREKRKGDIPYYGANGRTGWIDDWLFDEPLILVVEDETFIGRELPFSYKITGRSWVNNHAHILKPKKGICFDFLNYQLYYYPFLSIVTGTTGRKKLTKNALMQAPFKICSIEEQKQIVQEIESRLSVCYKIEETIANTLQQSEALRQSILKKAFNGELV